MKLLVKFEGGPSPGVVIAGERSDLDALADRIKKGLTAIDKGPIGLTDVHVQGEPHEWIEFEIVENLATARDEQRVSAAPAKLAAIFICVLGAALCYLAYRGLRTF
jgi:hypothetical protein